MSQFIMTLDGPSQYRKAPGLLGFSSFTDPIVAHPVILVLGIVAGVFLAKRKKR